MAPPHSASTTAAMAYPASHPLPSRHQPDERNASDLPHRPHRPQPYASLSNPMRRCKSSVCCMVTAVMSILMVMPALFLFVCIVSGPQYPTLSVAALIVSNLTTAAPNGATWKATFLAEKEGTCGNFFFRHVQCFVYYHWDVAHTLAVASAEPFELRGGARAVIDARMMTMERPEKEEEAVEDMDREWRSVGTVAVRLGLRMQGRYVFGPWWKKSYDRIEARCDNLRIAFANSTTEGSLVIEANSVTGDSSPSDSLPSCSYGGD
ncbi:hypothetical protein ACJRO7_026537 [Eucalyptus globulus]|uniref:Uncharacterized protein n=1 Tax=Eucalyptus globulus TaxID=34317 RepID=A0ABD3JN47_EUCGL